MRPPTITNTKPGAFFSLECGLLTWVEARRLAKQSGCALTERRTGLFTKEFTYRGTETQLQDFINIGWYSPYLGPSFQHEIIKAVGNG